MNSNLNIRKFDYAGILVVIFIAVYCIVGLSQIEIRADRVTEWLPVNSQARKEYDYFAERFKSDDFLILTWQDCTIDDPRLAELTRSLRDQNSELIQSATNGGEIFRQLRDDLRISKRSVYNRLKGIFLAKSNPEITCALIVLSDKGTEDRTSSLELIWEAIDGVQGLDRQEIVIGGYPFIGAQVSEEVKIANRRYLGPTIVLATLVALVCLRNLALTFIVFCVAIGASMFSLATIPICGVTTGGLLSIVPALVFVLATSGCIHLIRYSLDKVGDPIHLISVGWKPCTVSALTTSVGMLSLMRSNFPAIVDFGLFCALGVITSLFFQLVLVPWLLTRFGKQGLNMLAQRTKSHGNWGKLADSFYGWRWAISISFIATLMFCGFGLTKLFANVEVENMFRESSPLRIELDKLEELMGPLDQTELIVEFEVESEHGFIERSKLIQQIQFQLVKHPEIETIYSLINFLPPEPNSRNLTSLVKRDTYRALMRSSREKMADSNLIYVDTVNGKEIWRISLRFAFSKTIDFAQIKKDVIRIASKVLNDSNQHGIKLIYTGKTHLFNDAQHSLLSDLFKNFLLAFVIITPMLVIAIRSFFLGLISMLPNVFPAVVVFGSLGWLAIPVDLAIAMTACVALGIAVDDTTHFMVRFRDFGGSLNNSRQPIRSAISQCGPAMLGTTFIGGTGLIVYSLSSMTLISNFAIFIVLMLIFALVADLLMLPGFLFLVCKDQRQETDSSNETR